jgi:hypothetical protein
MLGRPLNPGGDAATVLGPSKLEWLDPTGIVLRTATLDDDPTMLLVDWNTDHVLTLLPGADRLRARWHDGAGAPLTPWFDAGPTIDPRGATMHLLLDGAIALGDGQGWRGIFRDGAAQVDPPPGWLAARPGTRLATVRHGRGYAVLPMRYGTNATTGDATSFELVTASGEGCGRVSLPPPPAEPGVTRTATGLDVGQDGTVIQVGSRTGPDLGMGMHGDFRWWPALLR